MYLVSYDFNIFNIEQREYLLGNTIPIQYFILSNEVDMSVPLKQIVIKLLLVI